MLRRENEQNCKHANNLRATRMRRNFSEEEKRRRKDMYVVAVSTIKVIFGKNMNENSEFFF